MLVFDVKNERETKFIPHSLETTDHLGIRRIKGKVEDVDIATDGNAPVIEAIWNNPDKKWVIPEGKKKVKVKGDSQLSKSKDVYSIKCPHYKKTFATEQELIDDIIQSGQDPNYAIYKNGKSTRTKVIDLIQP